MFKPEAGIPLYYTHLLQWSIGFHSDSEELRILVVYLMSFKMMSTQSYFAKYGMKNLSVKVVSVICNVTVHIFNTKFNSGQSAVPTEAKAEVEQLTDCPEVGFVFSCPTLAGNPYTSCIFCNISTQCSITGLS